MVYPYCMRNMIGLALNYREENGKNKELHKKTCELFMNRDHYSLLDKQGGSTMIESLFCDTKNLNDFMSEMKNKKYFRISGEESDHRFGPEYNYLLLDCLSTKFVELFIDVFRVEFDMKN